ncbi:hypothetical protein Ancab_013389 [Ancistrocladus abbreviatus]
MLCTWDFHSLGDTHVSVLQNSSLIGFPIESKDGKLLHYLKQEGLLSSNPLLDPSTRKIPGRKLSFKARGENGRGSMLKREVNKVKPWRIEHLVESIQIQHDLDMLGTSCVFTGRDGNLAAHALV